MKDLRFPLCSLVFIMAAALWITPAAARTKLVALPERAETTVRLDNPSATLVEEERVLTLQDGVNRVDFSWKGVQVDEDSIRLSILSPVEGVVLLNVSYPPNEAALVWEIHAAAATEARVRISYLLSGIDRLITYKGVANHAETQLDFNSDLILRNFSGEDFERATIALEGGQSFQRAVAHGETVRFRFLDRPELAIEKVWTFDSEKLPWDPRQLDTNVGIPVSYRFLNDADHGLGDFALWDGKARVYQDDGHGGTIFLGEDRTESVPVGEEMEIAIGDSRDIVVTQHKTLSRQVDVRRNEDNRVVLYDLEERIEAEIENFKEQRATLTMIQHIPGQWEMQECNLEYKREDASTLEFTVELPPQGKKRLVMHYLRKNVR